MIIFKQLFVFFYKLIKTIKLKKSSDTLVRGGASAFVYILVFINFLSVLNLIDYLFKTELLIVVTEFIRSMLLVLLLIIILPIDYFLFDRKDKYKTYIEEIEKRGVKYYSIFYYFLLTVSMFILVMYRYRVSI